MKKGGSKEERKKKVTCTYTYRMNYHSICYGGTVRNIITQNPTLGTTTTYTALLKSHHISNLFKLCFLFLEFFLEHLEIVVLC